VIALLAVLLAQAGAGPIRFGPQAPLPPEWVQPGSGSRATFINVKACIPSPTGCLFAVGDGVADDTAAIQAALDAVAAGSTVTLPQGSYVLSGVGTELLKISKPLVLRGAGMTNTFLLVKSTVGASTDVIRLVGTAKMEGIVLADFDIAPQSGTPGRHAINVDTTNFAIDRLIIERLYISPLGGKGIISTNPTPITNGFFTSTIRDNTIFGGILLQNAGDTIVIANNVITGLNTGVDASFVLGALNMTIRENNITSTGAFIHLGSAASQVRIIYNEFEGTAGDTGSNGAKIDIDCASGGNICKHVEFAGNLLSPVGAGLNGIRVNNAKHTNIHDNTFSRVSGTFDILTTANASNTNIGWNRYDPEPDTLVANGLSDSGATTWYRANDLDTGVELLKNVKIGSGGTTISNSARGLLNVGAPAAIGPGVCATIATITVTAPAGTECQYGIPGVAALSYYCAISALNTCVVNGCNPAAAGNVTPTAGNYVCRAMSP